MGGFDRFRELTYTFFKHYLRDGDQISSLHSFFFPVPFVDLNFPLLLIAEAQ